MQIVISAEGIRKKSPEYTGNKQKNVYFFVLRS